ncbi:hypothetical protein [Lacrimispora sp.]|uniref:hypothetical protein n=1 Tax=Lacrimispora sp. TaxID=2719234 RepID=UPI00345FA031
MSYTDIPDSALNISVTLRNNVTTIAMAKNKIRKRRDSNGGGKMQLNILADRTTKTRKIVKESK